MAISQSVISHSDGSVDIGITVPFIAPPQPAAACKTAKPITAQLTATVQTTGGTIAGGQSLYYHISAIDGSGNESIPGDPIEVIIPSGTNTNQVSITGPTPFDSNASLYNVYRSVSGPKGDGNLANSTPAQLFNNQTPPSNCAGLSISDTGSNGIGGGTGDNTKMPIAQSLSKIRAYWQVNGESQWRLGGETLNGAGSSVNFVVPHNIQGQQINIQLRSVDFSLNETPEALAPTQSYTITAVYPTGLGIGAAPPAGASFGVSGAKIIDTSGNTGLDSVVDGSTYVRYVASDATSNRLDFSKALLNKQLDNIPDGSTYVRVADVNADHTFHVSTPLNNQASLVASPADTTSYTSTSSSINWSWSSFTAYFPDGSSGTVSSGSQNFTGLSASTTYYFEMYIVKSTLTLTVVLSDQSSGAAPSSLQFQVQTVSGDGHIPLWIDRTAATVSGGSGGGGGTGGSCFSGDTKVKTPNGFVRMDELQEECVIVNRTGEHRAQVIVHHDSSEAMRIMPLGSLVTEKHLLLDKNGEWKPASELFSWKAKEATRTLYDLHVATENPDEMHYILENGYIAHNKKRVCFSGNTQVRTPEGWRRLDSIHGAFKIQNADGVFSASIVKHEACKVQMYRFATGELVTGDHLIRRAGIKRWTFASKMLPKAEESPSITYNVVVDGSCYFEISVGWGGWEANDMEGMS